MLGPVLHKVYTFMTFMMYKLQSNTDLSEYFSAIWQGPDKSMERKMHSFAGQKSQPFYISVTQGPATVCHSPTTVL